MNEQDQRRQREIKKLIGTPLYENLRPQHLSDIVGHPKILSKLNNYIQKKYLPNLIFWGPPGTGKTTLAKVLATEFEAEFITLNAGESGAKPIREIGESGRQRRIEESRQTILFIDEIHRFNKTQQDYLLSYIERGDLILVGATTENPSYELNRALLSRCHVISFKELEETDLLRIANQALQESLTDLNLTLFDSDKYQAKDFFQDENSLKYLIQWSAGDARKMLLCLEELIKSFYLFVNYQEEKKALPCEAIKESHESLKVDSSFHAELHFPLDLDQIHSFLGQRILKYDKASDEHYNHLSAFIKSLRGSDPDAAIYYLVKMIKVGENPMLIARRMIIFASEDIGNADPRALNIAVAGAQALEIVGLPEAEINLAHVVCYLATAPKSNRSYVAMKKAKLCLDQQGFQNIPLHLKSNQKIKSFIEKDSMDDYFIEYKYPHDYPKAWVKQNYLPEKIKDEHFYEPQERGYEKQIKDYLKWLKS